MSTEEQIAVRVLAPGPNRIIRLATSATSATYAFPDTWLGGWVTMQARISPCVVNIGGSTVDVDQSELNSTTPPAVTLSATVGWPLELGIPMPFLLRRGETHFAVEAAAAGEIDVYLSGAARSLV